MIGERYPAIRTRPILHLEPKYELRSSLTISVIPPNRGIGQCISMLDLMGTLMRLM